jgi:hypothetical protein
LLAGSNWIEQARAEIAPGLFTSPRLREIYDALIHDESAAEQLPSGLSEGAASLWSRLKEAAQNLSPQEAEKIYDSAAQILRARARYRELDALSDPGEKRRQRAALRAEFPAADAWYDYQKAAQRELRRARGPRGA